MGNAKVYGEGRGGAGRGEASWEGATLRPIESIRPGDWVLGHDGQPHRVVRVIRRPYRGKMIGIRHEKTDTTLWLSADHKVLAKRRPRSLGGHNDWSGIPPVLRGRSKTLRREMTPPERKLWAVLRNGQTGFTFRRQHPIGRYIADFYSRDAQLVVEVDGVLAHSSEEALAHDQARDAYLRGLGLEVLRVPAREVLSNLEGVYETIRRTCHLQLSVEKAEWVEAQDLAVGDWVFFGPQRVAVRIAEIHTQETEEDLYDLEVEDAHSFITELCVVHNCGSGTTAYVAEQWGRRWITCDTSRVAITIARQRLMTAVFDYYELAHPEEGVGSGFKYKTVPHITLKSIANNPEIDGIYARLHPAVETALAELNAALKLSSRDGRGAGGEGYPRFKVTTGGRAGHYVDFAAPDTATFTMPAGQVVKVNELVEWEVPFEFPANWPEAARALFDRFHQARRALQTAIDEAIARHAPQETLYDQPFVDKKKVRVTGPFTVEAVPAPAVKSVDELLANVGATGQSPLQADMSIARSGETLRQAEWRDELLRTGIRGKNGQYIRFARLEPLPGCRWLHAEGETRPSDEGAGTVRETGPAYDPMRVVVSFGPEYGPLEQRQVEYAWQEARRLVPRPKLLIFAAFQFDPEAAKDIDEMKPELAGMQFLKVQMNADLLTDDLKKKRASNESFWLIGQPDVEVQRITSGPDEGKLRVVVHSFDYYNTKTGNVESGGADKIAVWLLDTDYDGRSLYPRQVFFPMAGEDGGWAKLAKNLKAEIDEELIEAYRGTVSLPFAPGEHKRIAVKIVDDRGIESLKVIEV
jgi:very-short-patch-repair endonuclease